MDVRELEDLLFQAFPRDQAEEWDRPGLLVGNPTDEVEGVLCALDPTPEAIDEAAARGLNVLVTHHPAFVDAPASFSPEARDTSFAGSAVWHAAHAGVSLVAMHTNLDRSAAALELNAELLGLSLVGRMCPPDGFGAIVDAGGLSLADLAGRCVSGFGGAPRVLGDLGTPMGQVGVCSGSLGDLGRRALEAGCTCVITGECGYHRALDLLESGCTAILMGHDVSELPYAGLLARTIAAQVPDLRIDVLDNGPCWTNPVPEGER